MADAHKVSNFYYIIALQNKDRYQFFIENIAEVRASDKDDWMKDMECDDLRHQSLKCAVQSIVFSAMCLEAFIYGYAEKHLGKSYTKQHIEKLNIESKYIIVPKLVTGKEIDKSGQAFEKLKKLISDRNKIVHFKSISDFLNQDSFLPESMANGLGSIIGLMDEFRKIHPEEKIYFDGVPVMAECFA
ncbi:hypothetical protein SAMN05421509_101302 [Chromohalobacter canadensis]|uniref:HEPN AbiU2-like domain-containing protein n=1 Tax=Chromohalobacter canadensis TaxID=141389 RepID=A0A285VED2_9GAMM|nr:hypothetical protein [Chromohalobacter canadensis]SOC51446.1 hypothetical protein SAMN05421509_101302 [Chromohalobacter canadensis]